MVNEILIMISLRGGADALNFLVPYRDENYYRLRPSLAIPEPGKAGKTVIDLDGLFGFHPALAPLFPLYERGLLAALHAVGWPGETHSHFQAWEEIESGVIGEDRPMSGWLARYLQLLSPAQRSPLRAVAFGETPSRLFKGAIGANTLRSLDQFRLSVNQTDQQSMHKALRTMYNNGSSIGQLGIQTLDALDTIEKIVSQSKSIKSKFSYPETEFGKQLRTVEQLIQADIGLEAANIDLNGWDTHILQGSTDGAMARLLGEFATGLSTFVQNLNDRMDRILIVVMSEFGRRAMENGSGGTDHGQGGLMLFCGGSVRGGRVYGEWPGLGPSQLAEPGDLSITTDFRDALGEVVSARLGERAIKQVFPGYRPRKRLGFLIS